MPEEIIFNKPRKDVLLRLKQSRIIFFDLDGTLTPVKSVWRFLHEHLGTEEAAAINRKLFFESKIDYKKWAELDALLWKGMPVYRLHKILDKIPLRDGANELITFFKKRGYVLVLISGGISLLADRFKNIGFDYVVSNELITDTDDVLTGSVNVRVTQNNKGNIARNICRRLNISMKYAVAIGDSYSDMSLFNVVNVSIAVDKELLREKSIDIIILSESLRPIISLFEN